MLAALCLLAGMALATAKQLKPFPEHWGEPPAMQTRDYVEWPDGYGHGSGTVARWIADNLKKDAAGGASLSEVLFKTDFAEVEEGALPEEFMVLNGAFAVREVKGNKCLELPGTPLESFSLLFGPAAVDGLELSARIQGEARGRLRPSFGIGLGGVGGFRLMITPGRRAVELFRGPEESADLVAEAPFDWQSGSWTWLRLRVVKTGESAWRIEGRVWKDGVAEPSDWTVTHETTAQPVVGRPSLMGSPFSGRPIRYDDLEVRRATGGREL